MQRLEESGNEDEVRENIARGVFIKNDLAVAQEWLRRREAGRSSASAARKEAREEESLAIARRALRNSKWATIIAVIAILAAVRSSIADMVMLLLP